MDDLISIIVPVYNAEKTLGRCVRSLTGQSYQNLEIILVNDGSKDGSAGLCRQFAGEDSRIRVIDKPNGGVSSARNAGLDAAAGKFILFCDSDDWAEPDWCAAMTANYVQDGLTICEIAREDVPPEKTEKSQAVEAAERNDFLHYPMLMCSVDNKIFSKEVIESSHIRFPGQLSLGEDFAFVLSYVCAIGGQLRILHRKLYNYDTTGEGSLSGKAPSVEQCDCFYRMVTDSMEKIGAVDPESVVVRDRFVLSHFERLLTVVSQREDISFGEKMALAKEIGRMESFTSCSGKVMQWGNPIYLWLFRKKHMRLTMLFLILRARLKKQ